MHNFKNDETAIVVECIADDPELSASLASAVRSGVYVGTIADYLCERITPHSSHKASRAVIEKFYSKVDWFAIALYFKNI